MAHLYIKEDPGLTRMWVFHCHSRFIGKICNFKLRCVLSLYLHSVDFSIQIQVKNTLQSHLLKLAKQRIDSVIISKIFHRHQLLFFRRNYTKWHVCNITTETTSPFVSSRSKWNINITTQYWPRWFHTACSGGCSTSVVLSKLIFTILVIYISIPVPGYFWFRLDEFWSCEKSVPYILVVVLRSI